jgi:hypothetical protein
MTPKEFQATLTVLGWSARQVATMAGYSTSLGGQWASGRSAVPKPLADWLRKMVAAHRRIGPPPAPQSPSPHEG